MSLSRFAKVAPNPKLFRASLHELEWVIHKQLASFTLEQLADILSLIVFKAIKRTDKYQGDLPDSLDDKQK